jgi:hypothetical protein
VEPSSEKKIVVFELEDHSLWILCDCGLGYGPKDLAEDRLISDKRFIKKLPSAIHPRPKNARDWHYKIPLSTGYYINVTPYTATEGYACNWGLFSNKGDRLVTLKDINMEESGANEEPNNQ